MTKKTARAMEPITSFKGFDKNLQCRGFQFELGKTFIHEGDVRACNSGFHACEYPLGVFNYYSPAKSRFAVVEQTGELSRGGGDSKVSSRAIHIKEEIGIQALITAALEFIMSRCDPASSAHATGDMSASSATGGRSASSATGYSSASSATGDMSASLTTGFESHSEILPYPDGNPMNAIAIAAGGDSWARAPEGCAIVLCYRDHDGKIIHVRASKVGENGVKPGVWYSLDENGEFMECAE